jgi:hypothetical protein
MLKKQDRKETWPKLQVGEDDACALEYLHLQHNGNVEAAELNLLINLTAGQGKHSFKLDTRMSYLANAFFPLRKHQNIGSV